MLNIIIEYTHYFFQKANIVLKMIILQIVKHWTDKNVMNRYEAACILLQHDSLLQGSLCLIFLFA